MATLPGDVILVNDDPDLLGAWAGAASRAGFNPLTLLTTDSLLETLELHRGSRAIVVNVDDGGSRGTVFLDRMRKAGLRIPVLLTSREAAFAQAASATKYPALTFVPAPFRPRDLVPCLLAMLAPPRAEAYSWEKLFWPETALDRPVGHAWGAHVWPASESDRPAATEAPASDYDQIRAREIQNRLLLQAIPQPPGYEVAAQYLPAEHVGGDYYDVINFPDGRFAILVGDVSGKGVSGAMVMVLARTVFHSIPPGSWGAKELVVLAAERIAADLPTGIFMSLACAVVDPPTGAVSVVNAGHLPPIHWAREGESAWVMPLGASGAAIGLVRGKAFEKKLGELHLTLQAGEALFLLTDGVTEAMSARGEEFGQGRLHRSLKGLPDASAETMTSGLRDGVLAHRGRAAASDDLTILVLRRKREVAEAAGAGENPDESPATAPESVKSRGQLHDDSLRIPCQSPGPVQKPPPTTTTLDARDILLVQEDADVRGAWTSAVKISGFDPHVYDSLEQMFEALLDERTWRGMVVDLGFRGPEATSFLDTLQKKGHQMPVVLTAWESSVKDSKFAKSYPNLKFLPSPLQPRDLVAAIRAFPQPSAPPKKSAPASITIQHQRQGIIRNETAQQKGALLPQAAAARAEAEKEAAEAARAPRRDEKMDRELERAREIQARLLPETIPHPDGYEIAAQYVPAEEVGGDYYDVIEMPDGRVAMLVADVSGKGISAAMVMVMARTVFHAVAPHAPNAKKLVVDAAAKIARDLPGGIFLSLAGAVLDPKTGEVSIVNAGHMPPKHWTPGDGKPVVTDIDVAGGAIGLVKGPIFEKALRDVTFTLQPDEQLVFYTDGVNEAMDEKNEEFGDKKLHIACKKNGGSTAEEMAQGILDSVLYHRGDAPASDDITILVLRRIW